MSIILDGTTGISSIGTLTGVSSVTFSNSSTTTVGAIGDGQTWQSVVGSRALGTTYTNSTGKPIMVNVAATIINTTTITAVVDGVTVAQENGTGASSNAPATVSFIVPNGSTYSVSNSGSTTLTVWAELR
jgi:hypothetical protein